MCLSIIYVWSTYSLNKDSTPHDSAMIGCASMIFLQCRHSGIKYVPPFVSGYVLANGGIKFDVKELVNIFLPDNTIQRCVKQNKAQHIQWYLQRIT